jgi:hypothetical protein|tara:strand:+ start:3761 stop:3979 length:219 start_codon:yes stop_codon:yes gene_type:complete
MPKSPESIRIEVQNKDQAILLQHALLIVHQDLASYMGNVQDDKFENFVDNVKWTRKNLTSLNKKFSLTASES